MVVLEKHLESAQRFLSGLRSLSSYGDIEKKKQLRGLLVAVDKCQKLSTAQGAALVESIDTTLWSASSLEELRLRVADKTSQVEEASQRRAMQDFTQLYFFLTEELAVASFQGSMNNDQLLRALCEHAARLTLRVPSEATLAAMVYHRILGSCQMMFVKRHLEMAVRLMSLHLQWLLLKPFARFHCNDGTFRSHVWRGTAQELSEAEAVTVELAHGTTVLHKMKGCGTLLTKEDIEPIVPVRLLIDHGFKLSWKSIDLHHPTRGPLRCWKRQGCPVMRRDEALALLKELEDLEVNSNVDDDVILWWQQRYPSAPKEVIKFMVGQNDRWENINHCGLPFN
eukprot:s444_g50.t1